MIPLKFKSVPMCFDKEKSGDKANTIRKIRSDDIRFDACMEMIQTKEFGKIIIVNTETKEEFERQITDITYWDEQFIISWKIISNMFKGKIESCRDSKFYGIDCLESNERFGFFSYYEGNKNHLDSRPGHAIWLKKEYAEHLFELFREAKGDEE